MGDNVLFYECCRSIVQIPVSLLFGVRSRGRENVPRRGGCLIAANHQSYLDPLVVGMGVPRPIHYMARDTLFRVPGFRALIRGLNAHPIRRDSADREALKLMMELLRAGGAVLVFPEGTRTADGRIGEPKRGVGAIAARTGVPIIPTCVQGAFECWPRDRALPRPGRIRITFGPAIRAEEADRGESAVERLRAEWERMMGDTRAF